MQQADQQPLLIRCMQCVAHRVISLLLLCAGLNAVIPACMAGAGVMGLCLWAYAGKPVAIPRQHPLE